MTKANSDILLCDLAATCNLLPHRFVLRQRERAGILPMRTPPRMVEHCYPTGGMSLETLPGDTMAQLEGADGDLVQRVVAGETERFEDLMLRHRDHVRRIVGGHIPPDRVAEVA